jgi:hypothetical protein
MKKPLLNEEITKMRKMMGLNESEEVDLSKVDNPNAYTDDIFNYGSERGGEDMEDFSFEKSAIESASGEEVVQREFDDYDRPLFYSVKDDNIHYFIGDFGDGEVIVKYNAKTGERYPIGDLKDYDAPRELDEASDEDDSLIKAYLASKESEADKKAFNRLLGVLDRADYAKLKAYIEKERSGEVSEGSRTEEYDDSHGSPYDRGHSDAYYGREKNPHKWVDGNYDQRAELEDADEIKAYHAGYEGCTDFKDWGELDESEISEGEMKSGVYYDTTVAHEIKNKVGDLHKIAPYVLELGDKVYEDISGKVSVYDGDKLVEKFADVEAFLVGIKYGATPI